MINVLNKYYEEGLVTKQVHPKLPLIIWNYTDKVQYEGLWDDVTIMTRGLVTDNEGKIVARPFKKFFNLSEGRYTPTENFEVYEKYDGSLLIVFYYEGQWITATRGSFVSEQSIKGKEFLYNMSVIKHYPINGLNKNWTYLFEVIYSDNRIVCEYEFEGLVLLAIYDTDTSKEIEWKEAIKLFSLYSDFKIARKYNGITDYSILEGMISNDREGYVVRFSNGDRVKIKGKEYLRLHKIMTNMSTTSVWESLKNGEELDKLIKNVPDEFYNKIKEEREKLLTLYTSLEKEYKYLHKVISRIPMSRKNYAQIAFRYAHPKLLFLILDGKDYSNYLWDLIKPTFKKL